MTNLVRYNPTDVNDLMRLGAVLAKSGMFADARQEAQAVVKILAGAEMGFGAISAMTGIHVIQGRVTVGANLMAAAVKKSGKYDYRVLEMTEQVCTIEFFQVSFSTRQLESLGKSTFTAADAKKAQTKNMDRYARNMLFARAMSNGVRWYCPDALGGAPVYTPEEMGAETDEEGNVIQAAAVEVAVPEPAQEPIADHQWGAINVLGKHIYGQSWATAGATHISDVTGNRTTIAREMTRDEGDQLYARLKRIEEASQQQAVPA
jgi:hypothetical protein